MRHTIIVICGIILIITSLVSTGVSMIEMGPLTTEDLESVSFQQPFLMNMTTKGERMMIEVLPKSSSPPNLTITFDNKTILSGSVFNSQFTGLHWLKVIDNVNNSNIILFILNIYVTGLSNRNVFIFGVLFLTGVILIVIENTAKIKQYYNK